MKYFNIKQVTKKINRVGNKSSLEYLGNYLLSPQECYDKAAPLHCNLSSRKGEKNWVKYCMNWLTLLKRLKQTQNLSGQKTFINHRHTKLSFLDHSQYHKTPNGLTFVGLEWLYNYLGTYLTLSEWSETLTFTNGNIRWQGQPLRALNPMRTRKWMKLK